MNGDSVGNTVRKIMTDAKVVAALSDQAPATPEDMQRLAQSHEKLWRAYDAALAHIERLEFEFMLRAYPRWRN